MTTYLPGDLLLIGFPYSGSAQAKSRPAMVILDSGDADVVVARVTTQQQQTQYDVLLKEWQIAGLLASSIVRLYKVATLEKALIRRKLGQLQPTDRASVAAVMHRVYAQWP
jgi:mRNA interferase MazF